MESSHQSIKFGVVLTPEHTNFKELLDMYRMVEDLGFDSAWTSDHFITSTGRGGGPRYEGWISLTYLLSQTERIRGGVYVSGVTHRHPAVLAKMAATLDVLSNGRLIFGIGAAYNKAEHAAYGMPFYTAAERIHRLDEACEIIKMLWSLQPGERANYQGKYYNLTDTPFEPQSVQKPHSPMLIGGGGEKLTLRVVAKWADWWNVQERPLGDVKRKLSILEQQCKDVGRNYSDIKKTVGLPLVMTPDRSRGRAMAERMAQRRGITVEEAASSCYLGTVDDMKELTQRYIDIGVTYFMLPLLPPFRVDDLRRFGEEVLPAFI